MREILVQDSTSYAAEKAVLDILNNCDFLATSARINYNVTRGLPQPEQTEDYPLIMEGLLGNVPTKVMVYSVTAGYGGAGPTAMVNILNAAGFIFDEDDILTKKLVDDYGAVKIILSK